MSKKILELKRKFYRDLIHRLAQLDLADMRIVEKTIRRLEPEGLEAWRRIQGLRREIRRLHSISAVPEEIDKRVTEALQIGSDFDFPVDFGKK